MRRLATLLVLALWLPCSPARAGLIEPPPGLVAMWEGQDGAAVRRQLLHFAALGEAPGASAKTRLESGEAAWWLGVQDARAGRADSALAQWRRALTLRGDFDEGFAVIDALLQRGRAADLAEARALAARFAAEARMSSAVRVVDASARLAWALAALGQRDSAWEALGDQADAVARRPQWTRRFVQLALATQHAERAWPAAALLVGRTYGRDSGAESLLVRAQRALRRTDDHREAARQTVLAATRGAAERFVLSLGGHRESFTTKDGVALQVFTFTPLSRTPAKPALFYIASPADSVGAPDTLVAACLADGRPVAILSPRGTFGSLGPGCWGPEAWAGREAAHEARLAADAALVMDALAKRGFTSGNSWVLGAGGERFTTALTLASRREVKALLCVAPKLPVVEVAEARARLRALGTRLWVQVSPEEPDALELGDLLARQTNPGQVRVADSGAAGRGAAIFRAEPRVAARFLAWLTEKPSR